MPHTNGTRILLVLAALSVSACAPDSAWPDGPLCKLDSQGECAQLEVRSGPAAIVVGDTVRVYTFSDSGYGKPVTWSITGNAEIVAGSEKDWPSQTGNPSRAVLVRGLSEGGTTITATHAASGRKGALTLIVVGK